MRLTRIIITVLAAALLVAPNAQAKRSHQERPTVFQTQFTGRLTQTERSQHLYASYQRRIAAKRAREARVAAAKAAAAAAKAQVFTVAPVAGGSVTATLLCIFPYEAPKDAAGNPTWSGPSGGLGFIYSPSSYIASVASSYRSQVSALVATYGDSWYNWPASAQLVVGAGLEAAANGYSPWSTAYHCV